MATNPGRTGSAPSTAAPKQTGIASSPRRGESDGRAQTSLLAQGVFSVAAAKVFAERAGRAAQVLQEIHAHCYDDYAHYGLND